MAKFIPLVVALFLVSSMQPGDCRADELARIHDFVRDARFKLVDKNSRYGPSTRDIVRCLDEELEFSADRVKLRCPNQEVVTAGYRLTSGTGPTARLTLVTDHLAITCRISLTSTGRLEISEIPESIHHETWFKQYEKVPGS